MEGLTDLLDDLFGEIRREVDTGDLAADGRSQLADLEMTPAERRQSVPFLGHVGERPYGDGIAREWERAGRAGRRARRRGASGGHVPTVGATGRASMNSAIMGVASEPCDPGTGSPGRTSRVTKEGQGLSGGIDLLGGEADRGARVGSRPGVATSEDGVEVDRRPVDAPGPLLPSDFGTDPGLLGDRSAVVETGPVAHVELGSPHFDPGQGKADGTILVRDQRVVGAVEGQNRDRARAAQLQFDCHRGDGGDLSLMSAGIGDGEGGTRGEPGREFPLLIDAVGTADLLLQGVHEGAVSALTAELPFGALGLRNDNQVAIGRCPLTEDGSGRRI